MAETWDTYFQPGETLLWEGAPKPGVHGKGNIIGLALFGLPFLFFGIAICIAGLAMLVGPTWSDTGLGVFMMAFSVPFAGLGLFLVIGQWIQAAQAHRRIRYALSSRAAYVAKSWRGKSIECYPIVKSTSIGLEKGRRADTVWFHVRSQTDSDGDRSTTRIGFDHIDGGDRVFHLLRSIQTGTT